MFDVGCSMFVFSHRNYHFWLVFILPSAKIRLMKNAVKTLGCVLASLALCAPVGAIPATASGNPYTGIVERNVFGLKDPPPPPPPPGSDKLPGPPITLTGITTILGSKRAFMTFQAPHKPNEPPAPASSVGLTEGQREGEIEVLQIDEKAGMVRVNSYGAITNLTFEKNGTKPSSPGAPGAVANAGIPAPANPFAGGTAGQRTVPSRLMRLPTPPGTPATGNPANNNPFTPNTAAGQNLTANGQLGLSFGNNPNPGGQQPHPDENLTLEQKEILTEAYRANLQQKNDPMANLVPPTRINPESSGPSGAVPTPQSAPPGFSFPPGAPRTRPY
jgi:hypothetical protein